MAHRPIVPGVVEEFDDDAGLGVIRSTDGRPFPFHCTAIADGTRSIEVGADVTFLVVAARRGRWEAGEVHPVGPGAADR